MSNTKSKHAFGSEANIDSALQRGLIDAFDILFLDEGKIGWIDRSGGKVVLEDKEQVVLLESLPETGSSNIVYIYNNRIYLWDGTAFISPSSEGSVSESVIDSKIQAAKSEVLDAAKAYADEQVTASSETVVEF